MPIEVNSRIRPSFIATPAEAGIPVSQVNPNNGTSGESTPVVVSSVTFVSAVAAPRPMTVEEAVRLLQKHFFFLDTAAGLGGRDGLIGKADLQAVVSSPDAPEELRQAAALLLRNPMYYNSLDTAQNGGRGDGLVGKGDLDAFLNQLVGVGNGGQQTGGAGASQAEKELRATEDAIALHEAMEGMGTDEAVLSEILSSRSYEEIQLIKAKYQKLYNTSLDSDLRGDTSGDYETLLIKLSNRRIVPNAPVNERQAYRDAVKLHDAMDGWGTDEATLINIISGCNRKQLEAISAAYQDFYGKALRVDVADETSGDFRDLLMKLLP